MGLHEFDRKNTFPRKNLDFIPRFFPRQLGKKTVEKSLNFSLGKCFLADLIHVIPCKISQ